MPQGGNQLDLMAPLMRRKGLLAKLAGQLQKSQAGRVGPGPIGQSSRAGISTPSGLRSSLGMAGQMGGRAVAPGLSNLPPQAFPHADLSHIPSGFVPPGQSGGGLPVSAESIYADAPTAPVEAVAAPAAAPTSPAPTYEPVEPIAHTAASAAPSDGSVDRSMIQRVDTSGWLSRSGTTEAPAASAAPSAAWQTQGFISEQHAQEFANLAETDQMRLLANPITRRRFFNV